LLKKEAGIRKRLLATAAEIICCPIPAEQIPARLGAGSVARYFVSELGGDGSIGIWDEQGMSLRPHRGTARAHSVLQRCTVQGVSLMGPNKLFL